jgi:hypothetical protein
MSKSAGPETRQGDSSEIYVKFIDVLFAIVLGQSFVLLSSSSGLASWMTNPSSHIWDMLNTVLNYSLIITSWVGYHDSVRTLPIRKIWRFIIDIILLFLYYLGFTYVSSFPRLSMVLVLVFMLYFLWNVARFFEYRNVEEYVSRYKLLNRTWEAFGFAVIFAFIAYISNSLPEPTIGGVMWAAVLLVFIIYRKRFWGGPRSQ